MGMGIPLWCHSKGQGGGKGSAASTPGVRCISARLREGQRCQICQAQQADAEVHLVNLDLAAGRD